MLTAKTMRLLKTTKQDADKDKDDENVRKVVSVEVILAHCYLVKYDYQHMLKVLLTFVPNKQFGQLINTSPHSLTIMSTVNTVFFLLKFGLQTMSVKPLKLKIMSIWH